ncbi:hypothetical protein NC652_039459 [Populus alba x Populus x berolinensis]|nr:hypothetical protein NC652_039459 [Populus alba x Populus x berolinensis]
MLARKVSEFGIERSNGCVSQYEIREGRKVSTKTWEAKFLTKLPLKELIDSLKTHEITMDKQKQEEKPKKNLTFKTIHHIRDDEDDDESDHEGIKENIALIIKYFQSFLKKKQGKKDSQTTRKIQAKSF